MYLTIIKDSSALFDVWIAITDDDPTTIGESFVIGSGSSRDSAITDAVQSLSDATVKLLDMSASGQNTGAV